jgi:hypothetical protein
MTFSINACQVSPPSEAGVPAATIEAIRAGVTPSFTAADQVLVHCVVTELIDSEALPATQGALCGPTKRS